MEPIKKYLCCENSDEIYLRVALLFIWHTSKLTYPQFISVFCVKCTRKFTIVLSHLARKYKLKYVHQFCK